MNPPETIDGPAIDGPSTRPGGPIGASLAEPVEDPGAEPIRHRRIADVRPLLSPADAREQVTLSAANEEVVRHSRREVAAVLDGRDDRLLVVVGPCSVHDPAAALDYARRLAAVAARTRDELLVVMRVYFEKPRTTVGWKGLLNDPGLDGTFRVNEGLLAARRLLVDVLDEGLPVGCEFLDPIMPQYVSEAVTWGAIGARTTESQVHRQLASGLSMPVGFKNTTDGDVRSAVDAVVAASHPQVFPGITDDGEAAIFATTGNPDCHVVLRGGRSGPNYDEATVAEVLDLLSGVGLPRRVLIDASHANSGKDHRRQRVVADELAARLAAGEEGVVGVMLESFLVQGRQDLVPGRAHALVYGQSITDACIGFDDTADVLDAFADAVARRRALTGDRR